LLHSSSSRCNPTPIKSAALFAYYEPLMHQKFGLVFDRYASIA